MLSLPLGLPCPVLCSWKLICIYSTLHCLTVHLVTGISTHILILVYLATVATETPGEAETDIRQKHQQRARVCV